MKSTEVYREINRAVFPRLKLYGFKKMKSEMLGFYKKIEKNYLVIWFQCSQDGFDGYAGSKFIVEAQVGDSNRIGTSINRHRIPHFMTQSELGAVMITENEIKDKLQKPPKTHFIFSMTEAVQRWYNKKFKKQN